MSKITEVDESEGILKDIEAAETDCRKKEKRMLAAKETAKECREEYEQAVFTLRKMASTRLESNPLFDSIESEGSNADPPIESVTFSGKDFETVMMVGKKLKEKANVHTRNGRKITPSQMVDEIKQGFASGKFSE